MDSSKSRQIIEAIKADDVNAFSNIIQSNADFKIKFGRFPLLSVCYLFGATKILLKFEDAMLSFGIFTDEEEYFEIYEKFRSVAKKALRLFAGEDSIVYPAEMLAILGSQNKLVSNYKKLFKNEEIVQNIRKIYILNQNLEIEISTAQISVACEKLSFRQRIVALCMSMIFVVFIAVSMVFVLSFNSRFGLGIASSPILIKTEEEFATALSGGKNYYKLASDLTVTEPLTMGKDFGGVFDGDGHTIDFGNNLQSGITENLSGTIKNLKVVVDGLDLTLTSSFGIFATNLTGTIENCSVSGDVNIKFNLVDATSEEQMTDTYFSAFCVNCAGKLTNCTSNLSIFAENGSDNNAFCSAFAGQNAGEIEDCKNKSEIVADTVDVAGIVCNNSGTISGCTNEAQLSQTTEKQWHPNVAGIVINNYGSVTGCENSGELSAVSSNGDAGLSLQVFCGGIAATNYGTISKCKNMGNISAEARSAYIYVSGIVCINDYDETHTGRVEQSVAICDISARKSIDENLVFASGVAALSTTSIVSCGFCGKLETEFSGSAELGTVAGICSYNYGGEIKNCYAQTTLATNFQKRACVSVFVWDFGLGNANRISSGNRYTKDADNYGGYYLIRLPNESLSAPYQNDNLCGCSLVEKIIEFEEAGK